MAAAMRVSGSFAGALFFPAGRGGGWGSSKLLDDYRRGIGNLLAGFNEDALADELRHHEPQRLVGVLVLGEVTFAGGQHGNDMAQEHIEAILFARADGDHLGEFVLRTQRLDHGK